jgi:hypothetical protein
MIFSLSASPTQETGQFHFMTECVAPAKTVNVPLYSLENTRPGQKFPVLVSEGVPLQRFTRPNCEPAFNLVGMRRLRDEVRRKHLEMAVCFVANHNAPVHLDQCLQPFLARQHIQQVRQTQNYPHTVPCDFLLFPVLKTPGEGKYLKMWERSNVTPHSNLYRCTKQTTGGASSSGIASGINLSKEKGTGSEGIGAS